MDAVFIPVVPNKNATAQEHRGDHDDLGDGFRGHDDPFSVKFCATFPTITAISAPRQMIVTSPR